MEIYNKIHREITPLSNQDSFLVFDRVKDEFDFPLHFHPEFEINYIKNAKSVRRVVGDSIEEIDDIELVLIGPNLYHTWEQHDCKSKNIHEITIQFDEALFSSLLSKRIMKPIKSLFERSAHGILFSKKIALDLSSKIEQISKLDGIDYFISLLSILYDMANSRDQRLLSTHTGFSKDFDNSDKIKIIYDYIHENYMNKITLDEICSLVNMSSVSFNRFIKKRTGKTFVEYVNDIRLGYAARWLIEKDLRISEVAYLCGFNSIANFNRLFKRSKGSTPSDFKRDFSGIKRVL